MSTKIQQQQVQGLADAITSLNVTSGNMGITGRTMANTLQGKALNLANSILNTGATLEAADGVLTGIVQRNANAITATGDSLTLDIANFSGALLATGTTLRNELGSTGWDLRNIQVRLSGDIAFHSNRLSGVSGRLDTVSGRAVGTPAWPDDGVGWTQPTISGNLIETGHLFMDALSGTGEYLLDEIDGVSINVRATGVKLATRIGTNPRYANALGSGNFDHPGMYENQLYGEAAIIAQQNCATRIIQWFGVVDGGSPGTPTIQQLYLGGVKSTGTLALVPENAQWAVKIIGNAGLDEPPSVIQPHAYFLQSGLLISRGDDTITPWQDRVYESGVYAHSGAAGSGHQMKLIICASGQPNTESRLGTYLTVSGYNGTALPARFTATAYVSEMGPLYGGVSP